MTRTPAFWILFCLAALAGTLFSFQRFPEAFPVVRIELEMDREAALAAARRLAERHGWQPEGFRQAASFGEERPEVRTYVELEVGERDSFTRLVEVGGHHPYVWRVRHFREGETAEVTVRFTPAGSPYGFRLRVPEDLPGASLTPDQARLLAEEASGEWGIDLDRYALVEASQEARPGGRTDHAFVYQLRDAGIGEADFRVRLGVLGDRLGEVDRLVRVPEAFSRRYAEMRSANERIALLASAAFILLFLGLACGVGSFFLLREGWLVWKPAAAWGGAVAVLTALAILNSLPLAWMEYDTAVPASLFVAQRVLVAVGVAVVGAVFLAFVFMAAESLGRRAFPDHPQQWRIWSRPVAPSRAAVGRTLGGYLLGALEIAFVVAVYLFAAGREGWWIPSEALIQPDLLATAFPWLSAVSLALFSGFWEESVFRAAPVAGAALLGARFGRRGAWIAGALVLQALVFAAAHADYPQQPPHARLAELFLPALVWGLVYLRFGLVPVVLAHAAYNLTWFSLPLFVSSAPGVWTDRIAVVLLGLVPLWVVLYHGVRRGWVRDLPDEARNRGWRPRDAASGGAPSGPAPSRAEPGADETEGRSMDLPAGDRRPATAGVQRPGPRGMRRVRAAWSACAFLGALLWVAGARIRADAPRLELARGAAVELAREAMAGSGTGEGEGWRALARVDGRPSPGHRFVWQADRATYHDLTGTYLQGPHWHVRFARFTGPVEERAEELEVEVGHDRRVGRVVHRLPEERPGPSLEEAEARRTAVEALPGRLGLDPGRVREVSAEATSRPNRRDWSFTFADTVGFPLDAGEARARIGLAGDRVVDARTFVHTPEEWDRAERARAIRQVTLTLPSVGLLLMLLGAAAVAGGVRWARRSFDTTACFAAGGLVLATGAVSVWNGLPALTAAFATARPFGDQLLAAALSQGVAALVTAGVLALAVGFAHSWRPASEPRGPRGGLPAVLPGAALGLLAAGLVQLGRAAIPEAAPRWPDLGAADARLPGLAVALEPLAVLVAGGALLLVVVAALERWSHGWTRRRGALAVAALALGLLVPRGVPGDSTVLWALTGLAAGGALLVLHQAVRRLGGAILPPFAAAFLAAAHLQEAVFRAFPGAVLGGLGAVAVLALLGWGWSRVLEGRRAMGGEA